MSQLAEFIGNHIFLSLAFMAVLFLFIMLTMSDKMQAFANITSAQLTQMVNHQNAVVIDTRSEDDFAKGHIVNAINMPTSELIAGNISTDKLKDKPIIAYCSSGMSAKSACKHLIKSGNKQVFNLSGGINGWINDKLPVVKT